MSGSSPRHLAPRRGLPGWLKAALVGMVVIVFLGALGVVWALNTGHRGSLSTVHANSPEEALWRLETLALSAGDTSEMAVRRQLHAAVDLVVQIDREGTGRRIRSIAAVGQEGVKGDP